MVENGAISEDRDGDHGCSIGIPQRNVCLHGYTAKSFRIAFPTWRSWKTQLTWMADQTAATYHAFHEDTRLTVIHHNSPAAAARGVDTKAGYYTKVTKMADRFTL